MAKVKAPEPEPAAAPAPADYTAVARRYRPQQFAELLGQEHVAGALVNSLQSGRVAHAYLFTGARGVGKTSAARILAKALNCVEGPTPTPCDRCDSCKAIATGEDVDVHEIDGASNNKVEDVRDLRHGVGVGTIRSRYKIYIIDEVHMLSTGAFNALLKTLEEPPPRVKFIFATTEVQKIPITILSRCQRFDFAHVGSGKIFDQLKRIVSQEGHKADDDALKLIARRAGGSMRDSQSLLDQLLASCPGTLTADQVNALLGTAGDERVIELAAAIFKGDAKGALDLLGAWVERGLQVGELVDQLIGYWRSLMLVSCGGPDVRELPVTTTQKEAVFAQAKLTSLDAILSGLDVWTTTRARLRDTPHTQVVLEMAVVRLCRMGELLSVGQLVQALSQPGAIAVGAPGNRAVRPGVALPESATGAKKNGPVTSSSPGPGPQNGYDNSSLALSESTLTEVWRRLLVGLSERSPILGSQIKSANSYAIFGPNTLAIRFTAEYNHVYEACNTESNTRRIEEVLKAVTGSPAQVRLERVAGAGSKNGAADAGVSVVGAADRKKQLMNLPLFQKASQMLGAQIWHVDDEFDPAAPPRVAPRATTDEDDDPPADTTDES
ncbi:dna polymerase iii subunit gamma tau : DNA polymerase III, subunit gamma/tau OS=Singulisphaera acidiphila (strain ATCC BAA-1392 / DSM 18658 / VKM B-2454 / MOB10) GN=Sinac_1310 PE=4 SV=1: DNA_pol3_delta2: DNA_pol3_gamma3 [Gemmataceae bacterium]|nr:dna polymerase iii subunit gamma tau : DNA polymerase III, subunit gamma/tau OS=Singulisphaera acidiphila (strain ATCC BAA-1392 / DSM 18658 / VKM B-2454 / MOB10) GN=Sinac_1310 PE=4 SV=1: DNA_pol3_delta2: DNA_pol3_gamma3 [Gemmataceae bacterium]VTT96659.1 dna polymerase iii subunit gamma tau : DNA polymerase III, subunit gamma/tau OS=Singulisphaera acidiphila (strain ATCC BAA-1392 / DSM 18658 / VKM B-2454 / MOB10) GN=Sinac_1310 PE=4 SV=1: DNA_pol3_delta2: DNA_pol3_gamma3 [Gemmataceae bacterium]